MIDVLSLMTGVDIPIPECQLIIHQPTIKEISYIGENSFFSGIQCICLNKTMFSQDKNALNNISNFQIFMTIMGQQETKQQKEQVLQVLRLFFPDYNPIISPRSLIFMKDQQSIMVDEENFEFLQQVIKDICCINSSLQEQQSFNPVNNKAKEIADKILAGRKKVAEVKNKNASSLFARYISILSVGQSSTSLNELINLTIFQIYDLMERMSLYTAWDIDIRCRMAGGKPDKAPDDWMKDIHGK